MFDVGPLIIGAFSRPARVERTIAKVAGSSVDSSRNICLIQQQTAYFPWGLFLGRGNPGFVASCLRRHVGPVPLFLAGGKASVSCPRHAYRSTVCDTLCLVALPK